MPWSTKQLADLSGVSLRAIRHYHDIGLLAEPERLSNGYKQYGIGHLVTILRIKRMSSLGFSLERIAAMLDSPAGADGALHALHAELTAAIARLTRMRAEVAAALDSGLPPDITRDAVRAMDVLGHDPHGRAMAIIITDLLRPANVVAETFEALAESAPEAADLDAAFGRLSPDSPPEEADALAARMSEAAGRFLAERPHLVAASQPGPEDDRKTAIVMDAVNAGLNPAQTRVLDRVIRDLQQRFDGTADPT